MIRVALIEDNARALKYLEALLSGSRGISVTGAYSTGMEALAGILENRPDVILVDIGLPDISGIEVIKRLGERLQDLDIIVYTLHEDKKHLLAALKAGATGYILKGASSIELVRAIEETKNGGSPMSPRVARFIIEEFQSQASKKEACVLTPREKEVLEGMAKGITENRLSEDLSLSPHTIHSHIKHIYKKLRVCSRAEAVLKGRREGII